MILLSLAFAGARGIVPTSAAAPPAPGATGRTCALLIGVEDYADARIPDLTYPEDDVARMADTLTQRMRIPAERWTGQACFQRDVAAYTIVGAEATRERVLAAIEGALKAAGPNDRLVLFFSGHGEVSGDDTVLLLQDTRLDPALGNQGVSLDRIRLAIKESRAGEVLWLLDACHAGVERGASAAGAPLPGSTRRRSELLLASSGARELSRESAAWCGGSGAFACAFTEALTGAGDADGDGAVSWGEAATATPDLVTRLTRGKQTARALGDYDAQLRLATVDPAWTPPRWYLPTIEPDRCRSLARPDERTACLGQRVAGAVVDQLANRPDLLPATGARRIAVGVEVVATDVQKAWAPCVDALTDAASRAVGAAPDLPWTFRTGDGEYVVVGDGHAAHPSPVARIEVTVDSAGWLRPRLSTRPAQLGVGALVPAPAGTWSARAPLLAADIHLSEVCSGVAQPEAYVPRLQATDGAEASVHIEVEHGCTWNDATQTTGPGQPQGLYAPVRNGQTLCFVVTSSEPAWMYLLNYGTRGTIVRVYPWPSQGPVQLKAGEVHRTRPARVEGPPGTERFELLLSPVRLPSLEGGVTVAAPPPGGVVPRDVLPLEGAASATLGTWNSGVTSYLALDALADGRFLRRPFELAHVP